MHWIECPGRKARVVYMKDKMEKNRLYKNESRNNRKVLDRDTYPHEERYKWLTILLDSYAICDTETQKDLLEQAREKGVHIACTIGCRACCLNPSVPISELEMRGISWYLSEVMDYSIQDRLIPRLQNYSQTSECPLLLNGECSVYPLRPIACRMFYVFQIPCGVGEDLTITRPNDVYRQNSEIPKHVAMRFLDADVYKIKTVKEKEAAFEDGIMFEKTTMMHKIDWTRFIQMIRAYRKLRDNKNNI